MKNELDKKIITELAVITSKGYFYQKNNDEEVKQVQRTKTCIIKIEHNFDDHKESLEQKKILRDQLRSGSKYHEVTNERLTKLLYTLPITGEFTELMV